MAANEAATEGASNPADEETNQPSRGKEGGPSLNSLALLRKATAPDDISSIGMKDWHRVVYEGVLLENNTQKFWVDEKLYKNCFLVLPRAFEIVGGDEESCWSWITKEEKWFSFRSTVDIQVPKLEKLPWFLIRGRFKTRALSPNTMYEVAFVVQLSKSDMYCPVYVELDLPDGTKKNSKKDLQCMPVYKWRELCAGEFMMCPETVGTISFALRRTFDPEKTGLILKGVLIHPKDEAKQSPV